MAGTPHRGQIVRGLSDHPDKLLFRQIFRIDTGLSAIDSIRGTQITRSSNTLRIFHSRQGRRSNADAHRA